MALYLSSQTTSQYYGEYTPTYELLRAYDGVSRSRSSNVLKCTIHGYVYVSQSRHLFWFLQILNYCVVTEYD